MKTLVTGATGFVGSAVLRRLAAAGHEVCVLVRPTSDRSNLEGVQAEVRVGDLTDRASLDAAVKGCGALFHVAAEYRLWHPRPQEMERANVEGTRNVLEAARDAGIGRAVYTSSVATLGILPGGEPADEETPAPIEKVIGAYKRSKHRAEDVARELARDFEVVIVNPSAPVGQSSDPLEDPIPLTSRRGVAAGLDCPTVPSPVSLILDPVLPRAMATQMSPGISAS